MRPTIHLCTLATAVAAFATPGVLAQAGARIGYVLPAGGRVGTSFEVVVGGQNLRGLAEARLSGPGVRVKVKAHDRVMNQKDFNALREEQRKLQQRRNAARRRGASGGRNRGAGGKGAKPPKGAGPKWTAADEKRAAEIRRRIADRNRRRATPALADRAVLQVTILPDAALGLRQLRLVTGSGLTNALVFCVGELNEISEREEPFALRGRAVGRGRAGTGSQVAETRIELPTVVNGQIMPGDVDRFRFRASKGQRLVARVRARQLIPYLADAVPGWFQATLALRDAKGRELMHVDDYRFDPDPVLCCEIPADGEYTVEIRDAIYRGREDFVYRIVVGELPFVTSVFPLGAPAAASADVEVRGFNLAADKVRVEGGAGVSSITAHGMGLASNAMPFARDTLPECRDREPNKDRSRAQRIALPRIVNGRIDSAGDVDVFSFTGQAGQEFVAEVQARRLNSPVDALLRLTDAAGRQLAIDDDSVDRTAGLTTHHADPLLRAKLPKTGTYYLHLSDAQGQGGVEFGYRLRVGPPRPGFDLLVVPSCINTRAGATVAFTVHAVRRDGFVGPIDLALRDAPKGFSLSGGRVAPSADRVRLTLTVPVAASGRSPADSFAEPIRLRLVGRARIGEKELVRDAVAADDVMQAFLYRHLVPASELLVSVRGRSGLPLRPKRTARLKIPRGGTALLQLRVAQAWAKRWLAKNNVQVELDAPPSGITLQRLKRTGEGFDLTLRTDAAKVSAKMAGNLILRVVAVPSPPKGRTAPARRARRRTLGVLPAVPFEIVAPLRAKGKRP